MTHTPGPWSRNIAPASKYPIVFAGRNTHVAQVISRGLSAEETEANCNLIAAAPDLLAALKEIAHCADHAHRYGTDAPYDYSTLAESAEAAIAKAEGKDK